MNKLIYISDNDILVRQIIQTFLEKEGFRVVCFENVDLLYSAFLDKECELLILDIQTPDSNNFMVAAKIRQLSNLPIIMLTTRESEDDYVFGISLGIDVYLTKPVNPVRLVAHVRALLIKAELNKHVPAAKVRSQLSYADITIYPDNLITHCKEAELKLTKTEFQLLKFMFEHQNRAISRGELLNKIWGYNSPIGTRATDDTIKRLRRKLVAADSKVLIDTVWGFGFRLRTKG
ncbi:MAG: response regulator transcription factor [Firmicutes bacterium]|nr:response regulator transcription factor [Bacillota bacterium]